MLVYHAKDSNSCAFSCARKFMVGISYLILFLSVCLCYLTSVIAILHLNYILPHWPSIHPSIPMLACVPTYCPVQFSLFLYLPFLILSALFFQDIMTQKPDCYTNTSINLEFLNDCLVALAILTGFLWSSSVIPNKCQLMP